MRALGRIQPAPTFADERSSLAGLLRCPACNNPDEPLARIDESLRCTQCSNAFPVYNTGKATIPWLFSRPEITHLEWKARLNGYLQTNWLQQRSLTDALNVANAGSTRRARMERCLRARQTHRAQILELLAPLRLNDLAFDTSSDPSSVLRGKLPKNQGVSSYTDNVFRDWAWNNGENEHLLDAVHEVLQHDDRTTLGKFLTLGAGACRLSYDMHHKYSPDLTVVLDINPLLLFLASRVIQGEAIALYEFPIAPLNSASFAVLQECAAPERAHTDRTERFSFVLADGMNPPFVPASFDTILTPWLIDIIPQDLSEFIPRVNQALAPGGVWLNTGSLAFFHSNNSWCYSEEELLELLEANGFEILSTSRRTVPYLQSPISAHGRVENMFSFSARKIWEVVQPPRYEYLPVWIRETDLPIPQFTEFVLASSSHLLQAQVLAAIDGKRTINEIGKLVAKQYGLAISEATNSVMRILTEVHESTSI